MAGLHFICTKYLTGDLLHFNNLTSDGDKDFRNLKTWKWDFFLYWQNDFLLAAEGNRIHNGYF